MRHSTLLLLSFAAAVSGCTHSPRNAQLAASPAAPPSAPVAALATAVAQATAVAAPAAPDATAPPLAYGEGADHVNKDLLKRGYKVNWRKGEVVYCRKDQVTGSRFPTTVCLTEFQINDLERRAREDLHTFPSDCAGMACAK